MKQEDVEMMDSSIPTAPDTSSVAAATNTAVVPFEIEAAKSPEFEPAFVKYWTDRVRPRLNGPIQRSVLKLDGTFARPADKDRLTDEEVIFVVAHCRALITGPTLSAEKLTALGLKPLLLLIMGRSDTRATRFPDLAQQAAAAAFGKFEKYQWGGSAIPGPTPPSTLPPVDHDSRMTAITRPSNRHRSLTSAEPQPVGVSIRAPANHHIYGDRGTMHGIEITRGGKRRGYKIRKYEGMTFARALSLTLSDQTHPAIAPIANLAAMA
jgi:hypothetical protein